jgi:DNA-binding SARP family transcriptional activator
MRGLIRVHAALGEMRMTAGDSGGLPTRAQLRLVGTFTVTCDSSPVSSADLGSRNVRLLLKLLAVERARTVPIEQIAEVLWPDTPPAGPVQNIATLVSRLRRALGPADILGGRHGYRLGPPPAVSVDLDDAGRWAQEADRRLASAEPALALAAAARANDVLAAGPVLEDEPGAEWAQLARVEQPALTQRVRRVVAEAALPPVTRPLYPTTPTTSARAGR